MHHPLKHDGPVVTELGVVFPSHPVDARRDPPSRDPTYRDLPVDRSTTPSDGGVCGQGDRSIAMPRTSVTWTRTNMWTTPGRSIHPPHSTTTRTSVVHESWVMYRTLRVFLHTSFGGIEVSRLPIDRWIDRWAKSVSVSTHQKLLMHKWSIWCCIYKL